MTIYDGPVIARDDVSLKEPAVGSVTASLRSSDLADDQKAWFERARSDSACLYFAVCRHERLVGEIFLHDADWPHRAALVGYHLFRSSDRRKGTGSAALELLCDYADQQLELRRLVAITGVDNLASRRTASRAGFRELGPAHEGEHLVVYERFAEARRLA